LIYKEEIKFVADDVCEIFPQQQAQPQFSEQYDFIGFDTQL